MLVRSVELCWVCKLVRWVGLGEEKVTHLWFIIRLQSTIAKVHYNQGLL